MSTTVETGTAIRPLHVEFPEERIDDLRRFDKGSSVTRRVRKLVAAP